MKIRRTKQKTASDFTRSEATVAGGHSKWNQVKKGSIWVLLAVAGFALNDAYSTVRDWSMDKPDYLKVLAQKQDKQFDELKQSLGQISGSISSGDREAFRQVKGAVDSIEKTNRGLIQQLVLAKQENETLRKVAGEKVGVSGGYDFILAENGGMRIDASTVLGLNHVSDAGVNASLTSKGKDALQAAYLRVGQSFAYNSADGKACKVSLVSLSPASTGAAAFVVGCS